MRRINGVRLPMPGAHNVLNSLAAAAVAHRLGIKDEAIKGGFAKFSGVKRRFTKVGEWKGVTIIDDYGHHPVEVAAVLRAARRAQCDAREGDRGGAAAPLYPCARSFRRFLRLP
jgi:UDP-N-acetylmuramate--alanine ligase